MKKVSVASLKVGQVVQASQTISGSGTVERVVRQGRYVLVTYTGNTHAFRYLPSQFITII